MPNYRRVRIKGGTYFLTLVTYKRENIFASIKNRELLLESINHVNHFHPFFLEAYCILTDHIHLLCRLPEDDDNYSIRIAEIKKCFSRKYLEIYERPLPRDASQVKRGESGIWQLRFWEHYIRNEEDLNRHIDYIHYNPVKHGLVNKVIDWPSSSFFDYVKAGYYPIEWGERYEFDHGKRLFGE
jgi:putative transposase